jgi:hypothetical protein
VGVTVDEKARCRKYHEAAAVMCAIGKAITVQRSYVQISMTNEYRHIMITIFCVVLVRGINTKFFLLEVFVKKLVLEFTP